MSDRHRSTASSRSRHRSARTVRSSSLPPSRAIKPMWRQEVNAKRALPWTMMKWDEYGALFVSWPGGSWRLHARRGQHRHRCVDALPAAMCFGRFAPMRSSAPRTARSCRWTAPAPTTACRMSAPWSAAGRCSSDASTVVWRQARAHFVARAGEPFQPQLSATTDYVIVIPPAPSAALTGPLDVWDQGLWGPTPGWTPPWSAGNPLPARRTVGAGSTRLPAVGPGRHQRRRTVRNTGWVSIGYTGFSTRRSCRSRSRNRPYPTLN